jgi:hypothetical protein
MSFSPSDTPLDKLIAGFKKYLDEVPQEKVYLLSIDLIIQVEKQYGCPNS